MKRLRDDVFGSSSQFKRSFGSSRGDSKGMVKMHKEQRKRVEKDSRDRRSRDQDDRGPDHDDNRDFNLQRLPDKRKSARKAEGFGVNANLASYDDKDTLKSMCNEGFVFLEKVKEKLGSSDDYQTFLKCLDIYRVGIIKRNDLQTLVTDLLGKYPDLMHGFNDFAERCENIDGFLAAVINKKSVCSDGQCTSDDSDICSDGHCTSDDSDTLETGITI